MDSGLRVRRTITRWLESVIIACVALAGCAVGPFGAAPSASPSPAPSLDLPGVTEVASVYAFRLRHFSLDEILIGSALLPDEAGALQPYLVLHPDRNLYAMRPDGSDLHRVLTQQPCYLSNVGSAFSPDGQWFLCADEQHDDRLWMAHLPPRGEEAQWTSFSAR